MTTNRDVNTAIGMFLAYHMVQELRSHHMTPIDLLREAVGLDDVHVDMLWTIANNHAEAQLQAVQSTEEQFNIDYSDREEGFRDKAIKQSMVMAAIAEGNLGHEGKTFADLDLEAAEDMPPDDRLKLVVNQLDPEMVIMMADIIVSESYPVEPPIKDVLVALWIEGFIVSLMSDVILEERKDDPKVQATIMLGRTLFDLED